MFLRNAWYVADWCSQLEPGRVEARTIIEQPLVLFRTGHGELIALEDRCPHRWAPLSRGRIEGDGLRCMYHGLKFSAAGHCIQVPGEERVHPGLAVRAFPVVERHRWAWVWMGEPEQADQGLIPDASLLDQSRRRVRTGQLDYEAHHALISDNLLDLSHLAFLHEKTLGRRPDGAPTDGANGQPRGGAEAKPIERGVRTEGWRVGSFNRSVIQPKSAPFGDVWSRVDFLVPGIFISRVAIYAPGTAEACHFGPPRSELPSLTDTMSCQAVMPMTARTTRYFYSSGPRASDMSEGEADGIWNIAEEAFREDKVMIEAQQRIVDRHPRGRMRAIAADRGLGLFRALMDRLMDKEASSEEGLNRA